MLAIVTIQVGWLLAVPTFYGLDEIDHVFRAASVANGHWQASDVDAEDGRGYLIPVPADIVKAAHEPCTKLTYVGPDNCSPTTEPDARGDVLIASAAATYNPAWYFVIGTAARPFDGADAALAMRVSSMVLCDLLVAAALWLLAKRTRSRWAILGVALACTPVLLYSSVNAAPNGMGYCAGLLLWVSLLTLPRDPGEGHVVPLLGVAVSAPLIMVTHSTGLVWVALSVGCAAPLVLPRLHHLWVSRRSALTAVTFLLVVTAAFSAAWVLLAGTNDPRAGDSADHGQAGARTLLQGLILWPLQAFATLQMRNNPAPIGVYAIGVALLTLFVLQAWRVGRRAERVPIALVALASTTIPFAATISMHSQVGAAWQGRYGLALTLGIVLVATTALARTPGPRRLVCWGAAIALAVAHWTTLMAMFGEDLPGAQAAWTPWFLVGGALLTTAAFGLAATRPASLRG